ncbi:hypothetical protein OIV83_002069 [Microbotryomycetes sp. JL201]|nr:hypothetical protein OIV83_002069 [Microbotryomycetes sp. JL201]
MQGLSINDASGRRVLSSHFVDPLQANLAIEAALGTKDNIVWVPSLHAHYKGAKSAVGNRQEDEEDSEEEHDDGEDGWRTGQHGTTMKRSGGQAVCQIERNGLRYIAPVASSVDPIIPLTFLDKFYQVLETYIGGAVTEASIKDHFDIVLALMEEMMASGRPLMSETSQLKELVVPPTQLLAKVANTAATVAGLVLRFGLFKHFDLAESLEFVLDKAGKILSATIAGEVACRSKLSGMPDLSLTFTDPSQLDDCAFHPSVRFGKWNKDKVVSFVPPDGSFSLMQYQVGGLIKQSLTSSAASAHAVLPISVTSSVTHGAQGGAFSITLTSRTPYARPMTNIQVRLALGKGANGLTATVSGGGYLRDAGGKVTGGGAGQWEVVGDARQGQVLLWTIEELISTDRPAVLSGQYFSPAEIKPAPAFTVSFESPMSSFSGVRISALKVAGEAYSIYKGVKTKGRGILEVRCQ